MKKSHLLTAAVCFFSASASAGLGTPTLTVNAPAVVVPHSAVSPGASPRTHPTGYDNRLWFQKKGKRSTGRSIGQRNRLALWKTPKKWRTDSLPAQVDVAAANKKARNSMTIGGIALGLGLLPWTFWIAFPLGIVAIIMGSKAKKMGCTQKTGLGLGIAAVVVASAWLLFLLAYSGAIF